MWFNVGDRVRVVNPILPEQQERKGEIFVIKEVGLTGNCYDEKGYFWLEKELELVKEYNMKKEDLKKNDIVTLRNGDRLLFLDGDFLNLGEGCCHYIDDLDDYEDDLRTWDRDYKEYDIVKVERPVKYYTVFERDEEVQELTVDEISERLGYKVKVVGEDR